MKLVRICMSVCVRVCVCVCECVGWWRKKNNDTRFREEKKVQICLENVTEKEKRELSKLI